MNKKFDDLLFYYKIKSSDDNCTDFRLKDWLQ